MQELGLRQADLARRAKCPRSLVSELLQLDHDRPRRHQTPYLPAIHRALEWPEPQPALAPAEVPEIAYLFDRLDPRGREAVLSAARREMDRLLVEAALDTRRSVKKS
jgi:hypothetical protein